MKKLLVMAMMFPMGGCLTCNEVPNAEKNNNPITSGETVTGSEVKSGKPGKAKRILLGILCGVAVISVAMYIVTMKIIIPKTHYDSGISLMESGEYDKAIYEFSEAGSYKDSAWKIEETKKLIEEDKKQKEEKAANDAKKARLDKFKYAFSQCSSRRTVLSSDGKSIVVDSENGRDIAGVMDIMKIIKALELPNSLYSEMVSTNALMGRQTETFGDIQVSWSYHPDNGLDAIFKLVD